MSVPRSPRALVVVLVTFSTFIDLVSYSIAVPVLPDLSQRLGASPTMIGFLFASFGVTVLAVSVPMGAVSDRIGRKLPLVAGMAVLAAASVLFAYADSLVWLFAARLAQGAADAVTWTVGFALVADLYGPAERGRVMGLVMAGSTAGFMVGPTIGGWLYESGGVEVPFLAVAAASAVAAVAFAALRLPPPTGQSEQIPLARVLRVPAVATCGAAVMAAGGTIAMLEPVLSLHLSSAFGLGPTRIGLVFGAAAVVSAVTHPVFGHVADRVGPRPLVMGGLVAMGLVFPLLGQIWSFESAILFYVIEVIALSLVVTPSLAFMAEATTAAGIASFGVGYGVYNFAWALGLLMGPALGGYGYERLGFSTLVWLWSPITIAVAALLMMQRRRRGNLVIY